MTRVSSGSIVVLALLISFLAGTSSATTLQVCKDGCRLETVQEGIKRASTGDNVVITDSSTYNENLEVNVSGLTVTSLEGEQPTINGGEEKAIHVTEEEVEISSLRVRTRMNTQEQGFQDTAIHYDINSQTSNGVIAGNTVIIEGGASPAILVGRSNGTVISGNEIEGSAAAGINVDLMNEGVIRNNRIDNGRRGMLIANTEKLEVRGNTVEVTEEIEDDAEEDGRGIDIEDSEQVFLKDNSVNAVTTGVLLRDGSKAEIRGTSIDANGNGVGNQGSFLSIKDTSINSRSMGITGSEFGLIEGNDITSTDTGISVDDEVRRIEDNDINTGGSGISLSGGSAEVLENKVNLKAGGSPGMELEALEGGRISGNNITAEVRGSNGILFNSSRSLTLRHNKISVIDDHPIWFESRKPQHLAHDIDQSNTANGGKIVFVNGDEEVRSFDSSDSNPENDAAVIIAANAEGAVIKDNKLELDGIYLWNVENIDLENNSVDTFSDHGIWVRNSQGLEVTDTNIASQESPVFLRESDIEDVDFTDIQTPSGNEFRAQLGDNSGMDYRREKAEPGIGNSFSSGKGVFAREEIKAASKDTVMWTDEWDVDAPSRMDYRITGLRPNEVYTVSYDNKKPERHETDSEGKLEFNIEGSGSHRIEVTRTRVSSNITEKVEEVNETVTDFKESTNVSNKTAVPDTKAEDTARDAAEGLKDPDIVENTVFLLEEWKENPGEGERELVKDFVEANNETLEKAYIFSLQSKLKEREKRISKLESKIEELGGTVPEKESPETDTGAGIKTSTGNDKPAEDSDKANENSSTETDQNSNGVGNMVKDFVSSIL